MVIDKDGEELVDAPEVAERLGLKSSRQVLDLRVHRLGFPEPVGRQGRKLHLVVAAGRELVGERPVHAGRRVLRRADGGDRPRLGTAVAAAHGSWPYHERLATVTAGRAAPGRCSASPSSPFCSASPTPISRWRPSSTSWSSCSPPSSGTWRARSARCCSYLALNYWFIPHYESFSFSNADDVVPLLAFALAAVGVQDSPSPG